MGIARRASVGGVLNVFLLVVLVVVLGGAVFYLLSDLNARRYRISTREGVLFIERGHFMPYGYGAFEPEARDLQNVYAPITLPPGESAPTSGAFDDRADVDRALFSMLAGWTRERLDTRNPADFDLAVTYIARAELLPGISEEQRHELRRLRADVAYRQARLLVADVDERLDRARQQLRLAIELGTSYAAEAQQWIAELDQRAQRCDGLPRELAPDPTDPVAPPQTAPGSGIPPRSQLPPAQAPENPPPRWRL